MFLCGFQGAATWVASIQFPVLKYPATRVLQNISAKLQLRFLSRDFGSAPNLCYNKNAMGVKHDTISYWVIEATDRNSSPKDLNDGLPSRKVEESTSIFIALHRETPVHVKKQRARTVDAERPPSNRQRTVQPPVDDGANQQPGDANHPSGNGSGGDRNRRNGSGGGGRSPGISIQTTRPRSRQPDQAKWRWDCCNCTFQCLSYNYYTNCPACNHQRCADDHIWVIFGEYHKAIMEK
ncbi:hypothetical protein F4860DRAFT_385705 [Xylaria cubensis]|nr:hypothetical protein F4860DRAFT_385705 [Xylaria cubensis]